MSTEIRTGVPTIDHILSDMSEPLIVHSYGPAQTGKTTLAMQAILSAQAGSKCLWVDTDLKFDIRRLKQVASHMNANRIKLDFITAVEPEDVLRSIDIGATYDFIVIDTITSPFRTPIPEEEFRLKSILYEQVLPKLGMLRLHGTSVWLINQSFTIDGRIIAVEGKVISRFSNLELIHRRDGDDLYLEARKGENIENIPTSIDSGIIVEKPTGVMLELLR